MQHDTIINGATLRISQSPIGNDQPTLIFLHDSLGCIALWRDFPTKLGQATNCNVLVYDRQGYGKSSPFADHERRLDYLEKEADVLNELIKQCGIKQAILFGHSDGGSIALLAAAKYPSCIVGVITEGAHIFVEGSTLAGIQTAVEAYRTTNLNERLQKYHGDKTDAVFRAWADTWLSDNFKLWNIEHFLPRIKCPVLVIQGEQDEYGSLEQVQGIVRQVSGQASQLIIPGSGHTPHKEAQDVVLAHATSFINHLLASC
ncbi:alpha/beta fold hydrolase [Fibrella aquatica]|uniref:alpha/beta fold hydrolase n=1 Tax=Fibrella aquatica TaxID=3242487 RepID=UPI00351FFE08